MTQNKKKNKKEDIKPEEADFAFPVSEELISSVVGIFGVNYDDLAIKDKIVMDGNANLNIEGFTQNGLSMSDSTMAIVIDSDSSNIDLKMNIPEVSYTDFESTMFTFNNLELFILPSSDPQSLEFSALMDSLEIITEDNYVNLKDLNLFFKSYPEENGICLDIDIGSFIYPDFNDTSFSFEDLDFNLAIGMDGQKLDISVNLPKLHLINKNFRVKLTDLDLNVVLPDLNLSNLDLSIFMSDFHYTNFDDVHIDMDDVDVYLDPVPDSTSFDVNIGMRSFDLTGINSFDELFPMLNIDSISFQNFTSDSKLPVNLTGHISPIDVTQLDLMAIGSLLASGFDLDTYMNNMSSLYNLDEEEGIDLSGIDLVSVFENFDYSSLNSIVLNLSGLIDSMGIDLSGLGIDLSGHDLSAISVAELIDVFKDSGLNLSNIQATFDLFSLDLAGIDLSGLIAKFDVDNFDISSLIASIDLDGVDVTAILDMVKNSDLDLGSIIENLDYSTFDNIKINLAALIDSLGIDLSKYGAIFADLGIDLSGYDLSEISLLDLILVFKDSNIDMSDIASLLKLVGLDLSELELAGLIAKFDVDNFDISSLIASINLDGVDVAAILEMVKNSDLDLEAIFANADYSCLDAIKINLIGLIDSLGIDLSEFGVIFADLGIDLSGYDLSAISVAELMGIFMNSNIDMSSIGSLLKVAGIDLEDLDFSGMVAKFDAENFDLSSLMNSLDLSGVDLSGIMAMFNDPESGFAGLFEKLDYSCLSAIELNLTGLIATLGMDLSGLGIDFSDYNLAAITVSDLLDIFKNSDIDMTALLSELDLSELDFANLDFEGLIANFDAENFDMSSLMSSIDLSGVDVSGMVDMFNNPDSGFAAAFANADLSCLSAIELNLTGLIASTGIDLAELEGIFSSLGIDLSDCDLSAISLSELMGIVMKSDIDMSAIASMIGLSSLGLDDVDLSGLISKFDAENFDLSSLLESLDLDGVDISGILAMVKNSDLDLAGIFENLDVSCFDSIVIDLTALIESTGLDLSELGGIFAGLGIDLSGYDLSAIKLSELFDIIKNSNIDMSALASMIDLSALGFGDIDLSGLIANFDAENFDMSSLMASLNLSGVDFSAMAAMFKEMELDLAKIFENFDYSCLDAIVINLIGLIDSLGIDLAEFGQIFDKLGIDLSGYDLSAVSVADLMDIMKNAGFDLSVFDSMANLFTLDFEDIDLSGIIVSYDLDELDIEGLLTSLNVPGVDISAMLDMLNSYGFDLTEFLNQMLSSFTAEGIPEVTGKDE